jgi:hypothetical protein
MENRKDLTIDIINDFLSAKVIKIYLLTNF